MHLALESLDITVGDEVIVPTFSFIATANAVSYTGAKPIFVDSENTTWNIAPELIEAAVSEKTKADNTSINLIRTFEKGLDHYFQKEWDEAIKCFEKANTMEDHFESRNTTPSAVYINRCSMFKENPPEKDSVQFRFSVIITVIRDL